MGSKKKTLEDYKKMAIDYGFIYVLDTIPKYTKNPILGWKCSKNHNFKSRYSDIQTGYGCSQCAGLMPKNIEDYKKLALACGFEYILDIIPDNVVTKITGWKCKENHTWEAKYNTIQNGYGCPHCAGNFPKNLDDYKKIALDNIFDYILDTIPKDIKTPILGWKCKENHTWKACYYTIQNGYGCPHCAGNFPKNLDDYKKN